MCRMRQLARLGSGTDGHFIAALVLAVGGSWSASSAMAENRTVDGSGNNLANPAWGTPGTHLLRQSPAAYTDSFSAMARSWVGSPRDISNAVNAQSGSITNNRGLSDMVWQWGQFLDHDLDLTPAGSTEPEPIATNPGDPHFLGTPIGFTRSIYDPATGASNTRQHPNEITSFLDASMIYGSSAVVATGLRTMTGGHLRTSAHASGDLLPFNTTGLPNGSPGGSDPANFFVAGDVRSNEQAGLTSMHTLWVREHNRVAGQVQAANPGMTDEEIYQSARRIVGAEVQAITYNQWLPTLLGDGAVGAYTGYNPGVDATVATEFSTAAFRIGHTMLSPILRRQDNTGATIPQGDLPLRDAFFNPSNITGGGGIEPLLKGLASQLAQEIDTGVVDDVRNFLFGPPGAGGFDLASLNIQRGRDHGLMDYNSLRVQYGLTAATAFSDISADPAVSGALALVYANVNEIDPWVGMLAEPHVGGSSVGALMSAIIADQFERTRAGDRFFYQADADLLSILSSMGRSLADIEAVTLGDVIRLNTGITNLQANVFIVPSPGASMLAVVGAIVMIAGRRRRA